MTEEDTGGWSKVHSGRLRHFLPFTDIWSNQEWWDGREILAH